ncbi:macrophage mannose receptor 1-like [Hoplias malabaricus]|uniref:macrophage mannose receptor 1-like n=1 Tax=Hoplias malabaricus TaxID=27720 RepID=UPI003461E08E
MDGSWESRNCTEKKAFMCCEQVVWQQKEGNCEKNGQQKADVAAHFIIYQLIPKSMPHCEAQRHCRKLYKDLVHIKDQNSNGSFWVCLLRDDWECIDGGCSVYRNLTSGQPRTSSSSSSSSPPPPPPPSSSSSNCSHLNNGKWEAVPCPNAQPALCYRTFDRRLRTFHIIEKQMNRSEAQTACRAYYTDLVTVYSEEENTVLSGICSAWIGLYRNQSNWSGKWSNGDDVTFNNITNRCGSEPCCATVKADGQWDSLKCTENRTFMCYNQDVSDLTFSYSLVLKNLTWYEAQSHCRRNHTDLVSIRDQTQNESVYNEGKRSSTPFWIGLLQDDWQWTDGGRSAYRNWASSEPQLPSPQSPDCVQLKKGSWFSVPCSKLTSALCYSTYIHVSAEPMNWESALDYCKKENRNSVLRIESDLDQKEVERELRRRGVSGTLWLGLRQSRLFGFWIWTNGISVGPFSNWVGGRAPEAPLSQNCGAIDTEKGFKWRDRDCRSKYRVLCEEN